MIILDGVPGQPPPNGPTEGSVVYHVRFIVNNVREQVAKWKAAGVPVSPGNNGPLDQAYVNTPDGLRIGILENKSQSMPIQSEHVHFFVPEAAIREARLGTARSVLSSYLCEHRVVLIIEERRKIDDLVGVPIIAVGVIRPITKFTV
jgi:hypothetical protein